LEGRYRAQMESATSSKNTEYVLHLDLVLTILGRCFAALVVGRSFHCYSTMEGFENFVFRLLLQHRQKNAPKPVDLHYSSEKVVLQRRLDH